MFMLCVVLLTGMTELDLRTDINLSQVQYYFNATTVLQVLQCYYNTTTSILQYQLH